MIYFEDGIKKYKVSKTEAIISLVGGDISALGDGITYHDGQTPPSDSEIEVEKARLLTEWKAQEYARNRATEYPSLLELTVALYDTDDKSAVEAKRASVKAKYPKPS
jgi:hypothetical protein